MERGGGLLTDLERDLPLLLAAAHGFTADHGSVDDFTESALGTKTTVARLVLGPRPL